MDKYAFGNYLTALRTERGLSQSELGAIVGVSNKAISKWENGEALPRLERLKKLADYFGVPVEELVAGGKGSEDASRTDPPPVPSPTVWDGVTPEEAQRRSDLQAAYRKRQEMRARRWTKILLCCDPIGFGLLAVVGVLNGEVQTIGLIGLAIVPLASIFVNRLLWRGYESVRIWRIVCSFALAVQCVPIVRDFAAVSGGGQNLLFGLMGVLTMALSAINLYFFAVWRPARDFLTEQSYYRHL